MGPQQQPCPPMLYPNPAFYPNSVPMFGQVQTQMPTSMPTFIPAAQQQTQQPTFVQGRVVESEGDIKPNEIPMDGSVTFFPKSDYSVVFGKTWTENGTIRSMRYLLEQENPAPKEEPKSEQSAFDQDVLANLIQQIVQNQFQSFVTDHITPLNEAITKLQPKPTKKSDLIV